MVGLQVSLQPQFFSLQVCIAWSLRKYIFDASSLKEASFFLYGSIRCRVLASRILARITPFVKAVIPTKVTAATMNYSEHILVSESSLLSLLYLSLWEHLLLASLNSNRSIKSVKLEKKCYTQILLFQVELPLTVFEDTVLHQLLG